MNEAKKFIEGVDAQVKEWWKGVNKRLEERPPLNHEELSDLAFYQCHKTKAEEWAAQGDPNYMVALATVAPEEAERFIKVARKIMAEEAVRNYGTSNV